MVLSKHIPRCLRARKCVVPKSTITTATPITDNQLKQNKHREAVLYVHWPYCAKRCTYCNFNKYISLSVDHGRMASCLVQETKTLIDLGQISRVKSVFFGGGTPSLAEPSTIQKVIKTVRGSAELNSGSEITLEANPTYLTADRLREFKDAGINRISLGVQALNNEDLEKLGRDHSVEQALRCVNEAKTVFLDDVSIDVMFGRPGQTLNKWKEELMKVVDIGVKHVSLYQLTLERGTPLHKWVEDGQVKLPDNDTLADMYEMAVEILEKNNLKRYEVSNFALEGHESEHNQAYWNGEDYIGVGPGAHGRFFPFYKNQNTQYREERVQVLQPDNWMTEVERFGHATRRIVQQSNLSRLKELLMLSLRTRKGLSAMRWSKLCPTIDLQALFGCDEIVIAMIENHLIELNEHGIKATDQGIAVLDSIISNLICVLEKRFSSHVSDR